MNTIIEKIRAEVERRKKQMVDASYPSVIKKTRISELSIVLDILDDIQERTDNPITFTLQDQPVDWQKVAEAHAKDQPLGQDNDGNLVYLQEQPVCESKFKVGDRIQFKGFGHNKYTIAKVNVDDNRYVDTYGNGMDMSYTDANFELVEQPVCEDK